MDFASLPPEINSARMHSGPSATPRLVGSHLNDESNLDTPRAAPRKQIARKRRCRVRFRLWR